jgi:stage IV sporulation protein B
MTTKQLAEVYKGRDRKIMQACALEAAERIEYLDERLAILTDGEVHAYDCEITRCTRQDSPAMRSMSIRITDEELIRKTGGIVQGMSGSPIIQDGKLVGAVTHVLVNDPTRGYGIFIEDMLDAAG